MSYTKAQILTLISTLTQGQADSVTIDLYFDTLLDDLGRLPDPPFVEAEIVPLVADTEEYALPSNAVREIAIFCDDHEVRHTFVQQLEARDRMWRDHKGTPIAYSKDESTARTIRVYPIPNYSSVITWDHGEPIGLDYPTDALLVLYATRANDKIPDWAVLPICYQILSWEFQRPSKHQSQAFADTCSQMAQALFQMIDIKYSPSKNAQAKVTK